MSDELLEFLHYVENSSDSEAESSKGDLVKHIHKRVVEIKNDKSVEVEFMTLLERDREKIEETKIENAKNFLKLGVDEEVVAKGTGLFLEKIRQIKKSL